MRPLTLNTPKPLLCVNNISLIEHHIRHLVRAGITDIVINVSYLGAKIETALGSGEQWGATLTYSYEPEALETAGAINQALPLLGGSPFLLVNGDVWLPGGFEGALSSAHKVNGSCLGLLALVNNPKHHPEGDFSLKGDFLTPVLPGISTFTFSGVSVLSPNLIKHYPHARGCFALKEVFVWAMSQAQLKAYISKEEWVDVGTPERLSALNAGA